MMPASPSVRAFRLPALTLLLLGSGTAYAQAPTITGLSPVRNAVAAPRASNVALTFSQAISAASAGNVRVFSAQRGGQLVRAGGGTVRGGGTNTITFDPIVGFRPGETVMVTVPAAVRSMSGGAVVPRVYKFTAAAVGGTGVFVAPATTPEVSVGIDPMSVDVGDVDGDGDLDLLATSVSAGTVSVRLNNGAGDFSGTTDVSVGRRPTSLAVGDVDGDGDLDFLTVNTGNTVSVRLNDGAGTFSGTTDVGVGIFPHGVAVGDVDGDGDLDLLTANTWDNTVSVRLNDGAGTFSGTTNVSVDIEPQNVAVGDVDGDGDLDLLTPNNASSGTVSVRLNDGAGTFSGTQNVSVGDGSGSLAVGDVDGDGDLDFLTANAYANTVSVRLNDGAGTFSGTTNVSAGNSPCIVAAGDVDGDGDLDFLTSNPYANTVSMLLNDGSGNFMAPTTNANPSVGSRPQSVALGDVDGDGDLDFLTANIDASSASVRLNNGTGPPLSTNPPAAPEFTPFTLSPNPSLTNTPVRITGIPAHQPLTLLDATGRRVATLPADATGAATLRPDALAPGLYLLRAADGRTRRLVVE